MPGAEQREEGNPLPEALLGDGVKVQAVPHAVKHPILRGKGI